MWIRNWIEKRKTQGRKGTKRTKEKKSRKENEDPRQSSERRYNKGTEEEPERDKVVAERGSEGRR